MVARRDGAARAGRKEASGPAERMCRKGRMG